MSVLDFIALCVLIVSVSTLLVAVQRIRSGSFMGETPWVYPLGIYVWGDALILAPVWSAFAILYFTNSFSTQNLAAAVVLYYLLRSFFEVIYWLNHQATNKTFVAPLLRTSGLSAEQAAIIFQLGHMTIVLVCAWLLWLLRVV